MIVLAPADLKSGGAGWLAWCWDPFDWVSWGLWPRWSTIISWKRASCLLACKAEIQFLAEAARGDDGLARCPLHGNEISWPLFFGPL